MKPWITLAEAKAPDGKVLMLQQRDDEFCVRAGGQLLMGSRVHRSEEAMAAAGMEGLRTSKPKVLIGGLGLGFTLRAVLKLLPEAGRVTVSELVPGVVEWNKGPVAHLSDHALDDPRVEVVEGDVLKLMRQRLATYDVILLDVDNGPAAFTQGSNVALYNDAGVHALRGALRTFGRAVVWSAGPDGPYLKRLGRVGFDAEMQTVPAGKGSAQHTLFVGTCRR